ncbi:hypothetical protein ACM66B_002756 [Microbotryomycetes sp. NB124-2]
MATSSPPAGSNPYDGALQMLVHFGKTPVAGFKARQIVLGCFIASLAVLGACLLVLYIVKARRQNEKIWLFRIVKRHNGGMIVGNRSLLLCLLYLLASIPLGISVYCAHLFLTDFQNGFFGYNIASFVFWLVAFFCSWLIACASLQAFLLASHRIVLPPLAWNAIFVGGLVGFLGLIIGVVVHAVQRLRVADAVSKRVHALFVERARVYSPETDPNAALVISQGIQEILTATLDYADFLRVALTALSCSLIPAALVNISGLLLVCMIRRSRQAVRSAQQDSSFIDPDSRVNVNVNARRQSTSGHRSSKTALGAAERALLVDSIFTLLYCLATTATGLWTAVIGAKSTSSGWTTVEMVFSIKDWVAALPLWALALCQVVATARRLPKRGSSGPDRGSSNGFQRDTTVILMSSHSQPAFTVMADGHDSVPVSPLKESADSIK